MILSPVFSLLSEKADEKLTGNSYPFNLIQLLKDIVRGISINLRHMLLEYFFIFICFIISVAFPPLFIVTTPFLLFLGFGNQLFANYYKKSFYNFEISPKKAFNPHKECNNLDLILLNTPIYRTKILKFIILFTGLVSLILFLFYNNATPKIIQETKKDKIINTITTKETIHLLNELKTTEKKKAKIEANKPLLNINTVEKKDSTANAETPKIVVIKKQIVKKDTVYVEKE
jgi:hypothetical protein